MDSFASYLLNEPNYIQKMIITYYMSKKTGIFFDKSIILRTQIGRMFLNYASLDVDKNEVITALLLCNCKKVDNPQKIGKLETYAKEGAEYLATLGFNKRFCKICEGLNRYIPAEPRVKESDILELVDQFCGLILRRAEREAFTPKEALIILKERNLKNLKNRYLEDFIIFVNAMENVLIKGSVDVPVLRKLAFLTEREKDVKNFIAKLGNRYSEEIDRLMKVDLKKQAQEILYNNTLSSTKKYISRNQIVEKTKALAKRKKIYNENNIEINNTLPNSEIIKQKASVKSKENKQKHLEEKHYEKNSIKKATVQKKKTTVEKNVMKAKPKKSKSAVTKKVEQAKQMAKETKKKLQTVHRYTRKIQKSNRQKSLFSKEVADRIMNHTSYYRIEN